MRKKRIIIFDDEIFILSLLDSFFSKLGYEVLTYNEPVVCPVYKNQEKCLKNSPCADVVITDFDMPRMNGLQLLDAQTQRGCNLDIRNKAVMSGRLHPELVDGARPGYAFFMKPFTFSEISDWIGECEKRIDLSTPVGIQRKELRRSTYMDAQYCINRVEKTFDGTIYNISESGACIKAYNPLLRGQVLTFQSKLPTITQNATVQWVNREGGNAFLAGLSCC